MNTKIICISEISEEIVELLAKNELPIGLIDKVFEKTKDIINNSTYIQKSQIDKMRYSVK